MIEIITIWLMLGILKIIAALLPEEKNKKYD